MKNLLISIISLTTNTIQKKYMEEAIKRAIEGGYKPDFSHYWIYMTTPGKEDSLHGVLGTSAMARDSIFLDPLFFQTLGKAEGWKEKYKHQISKESRPAFRCIICNSKPLVGSGICVRSLRDEWLDYWHSFIDHLASGKDVDSFFKELLTTKGEKK